MYLFIQNFLCAMDFFPQLFPFKMHLSKKGHRAIDTAVQAAATCVWLVNRLLPDTGSVYETSNSIWAWGEENFSDGDICLRQEMVVDLKLQKVGFLNITSDLLNSKGLLLTDVRKSKPLAVYQSRDGNVRNC